MTERTAVTPSGIDLARQLAVVATAIFQVYASYLAGGAVGRIARGQRSLILPAGYAFTIWSLIFLLCGLYAIDQALPSRRANRVYQAVGWWSAAAFLCDGIWIFAYTNGRFLLAQTIIIAGLIAAAGAFLRLARATPGAKLPAIQRWIAAPALGLLAGWLTAASVVGLAGTLISQGFAASGPNAALGAAALLLLGGGVAFFALLLGKPGPGPAWIAYAAAVLWALTAVAIEQRVTSVVTTGTALICFMIVLAGAVSPWEVAI
jgi:hypothetical protein